MCFLCQAVGRNLFEDQPGIGHDPDDDSSGDGAETGVPLYYVWRRSDGCVMTTNMHPEEVFDSTYAYHVLTVTDDPDCAALDAAAAMACN